MRLGVLVVVVVVVIALTDDLSAMIHCSSITQQGKKLRRQQVTTTSCRTISVSAAVPFGPALISYCRTHAGGGRGGGRGGRRVMESLDLRCPLDSFTPRLVSVRQPRQRTTLQDIQKLWLFLCTGGGTCQFGPSRVRAQNVLQVFIPRLQLCTTQRPHTRRVRRGQVEPLGSHLASQSQSTDTWLHSSHWTLSTLIKFAN